MKNEAIIKLLESKAHLYDSIRLYIHHNNPTDEQLGRFARQTIINNESKVEQIGNNRQILHG